LNLIATEQELIRAIRCRRQAFSVSYERTPTEHLSVHIQTTERDGQRTATKSLQLASGRELSTSALFWLLQNVGWVALGVLATATEIKIIGLWASILENTVWVTSGWALTLGIRTVYRQVRLSRKSYAAFALVGLLLSVAGAPPWYTATEALVRVGYQSLAHIASVAPQVAAPAHADSLQPWWIPVLLHQRLADMVLAIFWHQRHARSGD
jgi:hypothetical protein